MRKTAGQQKAPEFEDVLTAVKTWVFYKIERLDETTQNAIFGVIAVSGLVFLLWSAFVFLIVDERNDGSWKPYPWVVAYRVAADIPAQAKAVACWPLKKAVECCVPGYVPADQQPRVHRIENEMGLNRGERLTVIAKEVIPARRTAFPIIEASTYDIEPAGSEYVGDRMVMYVNDRGPEYYLVTYADKRVRVTKATWDAVVVGDIIDVSVSGGDLLSEKGSTNNVNTFQAEFALPDIPYLDDKKFTPEKVFTQMAKPIADYCNREAVAYKRNYERARKQAEKEARAERDELGF